MNIVVCDDSLEDLSEIGRLLAKYGEAHTDVELNVTQFTDSAELYRRIQEGQRWDVCLLDMIMDGKTGLDLGGLLRRTGSQSVIIYITSSDEYALEAYHVRAVRYLLKPIREELFFEALAYAVSDALRAEPDAAYQVKTREGPVSLPYSHIAYVENCSRTLRIGLTGGDSVSSIFIRRSFDEEIGQLAQDRRFVRVHKSFLVNMNCVDKLIQGTVIMEGGKRVPVSKTRAAEVKKAYLMYVSEKYR